MVPMDWVLERVTAQLQEAEGELRQVAGADLSVTSTRPGESDGRLRVLVEGENSGADLLVDVENEVAVARQMEAQASTEAQALIKACKHLGRKAECGSLLVPGDAVRLNDATWERAGYRKTFVLPLEAGEDAADAGGEPLAESEGLLRRDQVREYVSGVERALNRPLEWAVSMAERPYIVSLDVASSLERGEGAPFHCFIHFHELTRACYVEKIVVPEEERGQGIGRRVAGEIRRLAAAVGCGYIYLVAKKDAERFWRRRGYRPVHRANYRLAARRARALRKEPGWEVVRVEGRKLKHPVWRYRNHPQDDLDLAKSLRLTPS